MPALPELNFAQAVGLLSFALGIFCFYQKNDKKLKLVMLCVNLNNTLHYALLGAWTASIASIFSSVRTGLALKTTSPAVAYGFIGVTLAFGGYFANNWLDMLPILGACIGTYAIFCLSHIKMRIAFLAGAVCWLANNIIVGSIGGTLLECTLLCVNLTTIYRLHFNKPPPALP